MFFQITISQICLVRVLMKGMDILQSKWKENWAETITSHYVLTKLNQLIAHFTHKCCHTPTSLICLTLILDLDTVKSPNLLVLSEPSIHSSSRFFNLSHSLKLSGPRDNPLQLLFRSVHVSQQNVGQIANISSFQVCGGTQKCA